MFTGIVELGKVVAQEPRERLLVLAIDAGATAEGVRVGDSVAVNGACLTVTRVAGGTLCFEAVRETLERTSLADLRPGSPVNLERALRADSRLDGHIVQGHVDGTGRVAGLDRDREDVRLRVECGPELAAELVPKGSVAIEGVSLTVVAVAEDGFEVVLIPHTLARTTLGSKRIGERVNLEADVLGKYVKRHLERLRAAGA